MGDRLGVAKHHATKTAQREHGMSELPRRIWTSSNADCHGGSPSREVHAAVPSCLPWHPTASEFRTHAGGDALDGAISGLRPV